MLPAGDSERLLAAREATRLSREAAWLFRSARVADDRWSGLFIDSGDACMEQARQYREQLERRRPRGDRAR
jgi:hypothetical protein